MRSDGYEYHKMLLIYVDDITIVSHLGDQLSKTSSTFTRPRNGVKVRL